MCLKDGNRGLTGLRLRHVLVLRDGVVTSCSLNGGKMRLRHVLEDGWRLWSFCSAQEDVQRMMKLCPKDGSTDALKRVALLPPPDGKGGLQKSWE
jgi:hypothetical protein